MEFTPISPNIHITKETKMGQKKEKISLYIVLSFFVFKPKQTCSSHLRLRLPTTRKSSASVCLLSFLGRRRPLEVPDLFYQIVLLVTELLILRSVRLEVAQELHQFGLVLQQYVHHRLSLAGVCHKHLVQSRSMRLDAVNRRRMIRKEKKRKEKAERPSVLPHSP